MTERGPRPIAGRDEAWLAAAACAAGDRTALICDGHEVSFRSLDRGARALATRMAAAGLRPGTRIAVLMAPSLRFVELLHACQYRGLVFVPLNDRLAIDELTSQLALVEPDWLVFDDRHALAARELGCLYDRVRLFDGDSIVTQADDDSGVRSPAAKVAIDPQAPLTIVFTSGTTARPKGVVLTNDNHRASAVSAMTNLGVREDDVWLCVLPLFHVGGLSILVRSALYGTPVVLHPSFDAGDACRAMREHRVTLLSLVSTMLARVLDAPECEHAAHELRCVLLGGGRLPPVLLERAYRARLPIIASYGMTETGSQVTATMPGDAYAQPTSAGRPLAGVSVRIARADEDGVGEIEVNADQVTGGYFGDPAATAAVLREGWLLTGDIGRLDATGNLHVLTRRSDLIVTGGENVVPEDIEAVLLTHPQVAEAAVYGVSDDTWGQCVAAAVVVRDPARVTPEALLAWCRERLTAARRPRELRVVASLPRTAAGKLERRRLQTARVLSQSKHSRRRYP